jgi:phosphate transport system protein
MSRNRFHDTLDQTSDRVLYMGDIIDHLLGEIVIIFNSKSAEKSHIQTLLNKEKEIDSLEIEIEQNCLELLALQQPVAIDLRMIISLLKISSDLERMGDHIRKILRKARKVVKLHEFEHFSTLAEMTILLRQMVQQIMVAFKNKDDQIVNNTLKTEDRINEIQRSLFREFITRLELNPNKTIISSEIYLLFITRFLERIGDHIENIGERIHFMITGELPPTS